MRDIEDGQLGDTLRMKKSGTPGDRSAPIVPGEEDSLLAELVNDGDYVGDQFRKSVGRNSCRFAAEVVTALVGHNDAKAGVGQWFNLVAPAIPEFGKAVKKQDDLAVARAGGDGV
jgi:hypothetical protein